jgi:hypothetical protein
MRFVTLLVSIVILVAIANAVEIWALGSALFRTCSANTEIAFAFGVASGVMSGLISWRVSR